MQKYSDLIMGLISGIVLMFLNNNIVSTTLISIFTLFNPINSNKISIFLFTWSLRIITLLSFIGILITLTYTFLILKKLLIKNK